MTAIRRTDDDQPRDPLRIALGEGEPHHAAVGPAGDGSERCQAEVIEKLRQRLRLIVAGDAGEDSALRGRTRGAGLRARGVPARAEVVEAEDLVLVGVEGTSGTHDLRPPAVARIAGEADLAVGGDAAQRAHHRRPGGADQAPGEPRIAQFPAVLERKDGRHREHAFAHRVRPQGVRPRRLGRRGRPHGGQPRGDYWDRFDREVHPMLRIRVAQSHRPPAERARPRTRRACRVHSHSWRPRGAPWATLTAHL